MNLFPWICPKWNDAYFRPVDTLPNGQAVIEVGSFAHAACMKALAWGQPRGMAVTWLTKHGKPHLYTPH